MIFVVDFCSLRHESGEKATFHLADEFPIVEGQDSLIATEEEEIDWDINEEDNRYVSFDE